VAAADARVGGGGGWGVAPTKDARARSPKLPLPAGGILRFSRKLPFAKEHPPRQLLAGNEKRPRGPSPIG